MLITEVARGLDEWLVYCSAALDGDFSQVNRISTYYYLPLLKSFYCDVDEKVYVEVKVHP